MRRAYEEVAGRWREGGGHGCRAGGGHVRWVGGAHDLRLSAPAHLTMHALRHSHAPRRGVRKLPKLYFAAPHAPLTAPCSRVLVRTAASHRIPPHWSRLPLRRVPFEVQEGDPTILAASRQQSSHYPAAKQSANCSNAVSRLQHSSQHKQSAFCTKASSPVCRAPPPKVPALSPSRSPSHPL